MTICQYVRDGMNIRISEAREIFNSIRHAESNEGGVHSPTVLSSTLRGLIYVSLYGAIEYTITNGTQAFINYLCGLNVDIRHLECSLHSIALDPQLNSVRDSSDSRKKWAARRAVFARIEEGAVCAIPDMVFGTFLHNVYPKTISEIFLCLGVEKEATADVRDIHYFNEITEKRNSVAHGREAAGSVGEGLSVGDFEIRLNAAYSICSYFLDSLDEHAIGLRFVRSNYRSAYQVSSGD